MDVTPIKVPQGLALVLNSAGEKSDVDFNYLVATAQRESSMNPAAKASSSSAVGLFQFLDSTWLQVMKQEGPRLGYQAYADAITVDQNGDYVIKDKSLRADVLKLRENPQVAADMAAAFTRSNGEYLQQKFGRMPSPGELYIAHFLGPQGAEKMFRAGLDDPDQVASKLFPRQAKANPQIFYDHGHARTIREVYKALVAKHNDTVVAAPAVDATQVATAAPDAVDPKFAAQQLAGVDAKGWPTDALPSRFTKADMSFTSLFATVAGGASQGPLIGTEAAGPLIAARGVSPLAVTAATNAADPALSALMPIAPDAESAPLSAIDAAAPMATTTVAEATEPMGFVPLPAPAPLTVESMQAQAVTPVLSAAAALAPEIAGHGGASQSTDTPELSNVPPTDGAALPIDLGIPSAVAPADATVAPVVADTGVPRARILMTPPDDAAGSSPFFTQLLGAGS